MVALILIFFCIFSVFCVNGNHPVTAYFNCDLTNNLYALVNACSDTFLMFLFNNPTMLDALFTFIYVDQIQVSC